MELSPEELKLLLYAHHEARYLGQVLGIDEIEAWGMVCPICERAMYRKFTIEGPLKAFKIVKDE